MLTDPNIRWELIERLYRSYLSGSAATDEERPEWIDQVDNLSADKREVLTWKIEEGDSAIALLLKAMNEQGAKTIAELGRAKKGGDQC